MPSLPKNKKAGRKATRKVSLGAQVPGDTTQVVPWSKDSERASKLVLRVLASPQGHLSGTLDVACEVAAKMAVSGMLGRPTDHSQDLTDFYKAIFAQMPSSSSAPTPLPPICELPADKLGVADLRAAAERAKINKTGNKAALLARMPQLPPPDLLPRARAERGAREAREKAAKMKDPEKRVPAKHAKNTYHLTDADLAPLDCQRAPNPHDPTYAPMRLYLLSDVRRVAYVKFGGAAPLQSHHDAHKAASEQRRRNKEARAAERDAAQAAAAAAAVAAAWNLSDED